MQVKYVRSRQFDVATEHGPQTRVFEVGDIVELPELHARMEIMQGYAELEGEEPAEVIVDEPLNGPVTPNEDEQPEDEQPEDEQPEDEQPEDEQPEDEQPEDEQPASRRRGRRS
jgi:outer membrane biosynthesis protein TonB